MKKVEFDKVTEVFAEIVIEQAEKKEVKPEEINLILFPYDKNGDGNYRTRVRIFSLTGAFSDEVERLKKITWYDAMGHVSKAIMEIFKSEVMDHNGRLENHLESESVHNFPKPIGLDKLECYIGVKKVVKDDDEYWKVEMNMIYAGEFLRQYDVVEEFKDADLDEV
jgi:hypothetical protein